MREEDIGEEIGEDIGEEMERGGCVHWSAPAPARRPALRSRYRPRSRTSSGRQPI